MNELLLPGGVVASAAAIILGYLFGGSIRRSDANRLWDEIWRLNKKLEEDADQAESRLKETQVKLDLALAWQAEAIPCLRACSKTSPAMKERISNLIRLNDEAINFTNGDTI